MKNSLIKILLLFILNSCGNKSKLELHQEWYDSNKTEIKREYNILKSSKSSNSIEGKYKEYYRNGIIRLEGNYFENQKHGTFIKYDEKGMKITEQVYRFGMLDSISRDYYSNGIIKLECMYSKDTLDGQMKEYFESGNISKIINIDKGVKQGESRLFYDSGQLQAILNYKDGKLDGSVISYDTIGTVIKKKYFKEGLEISD